MVTTGKKYMVIHLVELLNQTRIKFIGKNANFRSDKNIVDVLNNMRPELPQFPKNTEAKGEIDILHTNSWVGNRRTGGHWGEISPLKLLMKFSITQ